MTTPQTKIRSHTLPIVLTVEAPVLVHATGMGRAGLDSPTLRNARNEIVLPGTLVHGRVRAALAELDDLSPVSSEELDVWFGARDRKRHERAKAVVFDDLICVTAESTNPKDVGADEIVRIRMDEKSGAVRRGMLQVVEAPFPIGSKVTFEGTVRTAVADEDVDRVRTAIRAALRWNTQVGALRTLGFGRVVSAEVGEGARPSREGVPSIDTSALALRSRTAEDPDPAAVTVVLRFRQPLCVPARRLSNNLFESDAVLSGATLKGAIAAQWTAALGKDSACIQAGFDSDRPDLSAAFERLRVGTFVPVARQRPENWPDSRMQRPVALPLTLAAAGEGVFQDLRACPPGTVFDITKGGETFFAAPRFAPDWKEDDETAADLARGWLAPDRDLRVRTSIDHEQRRVNNAELFAYEHVLADEHLWIGEIGVNDADADETRKVLGDLKSLLGEAGLWWVGKTKASADMLWLNDRALDDHLPDRRVTDADTAWTVVLQTPALMLGPGLSETSDGTALHAACAAYWADVSGGALSLTRQWSRQRLWGGPYAAHSYQANVPYRPFLITEEGAVFCLEAAAGRESDARKCLRLWRRQGLPLTRALAGHYGLGEDHTGWWRGTPFVPENGYGAIHVDPALPKDMPVASPEDGVVAVSVDQGDKA
ncbi:RAMP superfamily CRISPR-associated protein [Roseospira navarrensis]|uniref:CRISPR type III-associated protein domain-containing protein n=1 Tax=Roseospira navarrensis TaxID=140058 RepID=A0A7X1ZGN0_9PROT|nr:RAMP superfamily CRISPR-associated protein [Roseospira navarrensis]MQX38171.1 hypothetical protein [Roseospira navarrensis]